MLVPAFLAPIPTLRLVYRTEMDESAAAAIGFIQQCVHFEFDFFFDLNQMFLLPQFSFRSIFYVIGVIQFVDPWHVGCAISVDVFMLATDVLVVHLPRPTAK